MSDPAAKPKAGSRELVHRKPKFNLGEFIREVRTEARRVVWPTRRETVSTAVFVAIFMSILAVFFLGVDTLFGWIVKQLLALA